MYYKLNRETYLQCEQNNDNNIKVLKEEKKVSTKKDVATHGACYMNIYT